MDTMRAATGIDMEALHEGFGGSEDVLEQMLGLYETQAAERMVQLGGHLAAWEAEAARGVLHSLVNISGAVRAYGMSSLAKSVGEAIKRGDRSQAVALGEALRREAALVMEHAHLLRQAIHAGGESVWALRLPGH